MDNDRDRRSWPDEDRPADPAIPERDAAPSAEPPATASGADEPWMNPEQPERVIAEPPDSEPATTDPLAADAAAPAEIESWPSQEATEAPVDDTRSWPTEPRAADAASTDAWPTAASERSDATMDADPWGRQDFAADASGSEPMPPDAGVDVGASAGAPAPDAAEVAAVAAVGGLGDPIAAPDEVDSGPDTAAWPDAERAPEEVEAYPVTDAAAVAAAPVPAAGGAPAHAVPDAEGSTGESTRCPRCGTENRPGLSFCRNCGQRLVAAGAASTIERPGAPEGTMACPRCGTHNRAGVAFCQNCGANLRGTAEGYVPPAAAVAEGEAEAAPQTRGAVLGPVVLLIGLAGLITGYLLPFAYGQNSLFERAWGADGYGIAFWNGYPDVGASLADQAYFGLTAPIPILGLLLLALAVAGFVRAAPGALHSLGLGIALLWSVGLIVLFLLVEVLGNWDGDMVGLLRVLTPAGIIFFLSSLIVVIGALTRFSRG